MRNALLRTALLLALVLVFPHDVIAQSDVLEWSEPQRIIGTSDPAHFYYGSVTDTEGTLHLFWTQIEDGEQSAIFYSTWNGFIWTSPVDIVLTPVGSTPRFLDAEIDEDGIIHLIFFGGDDFDGRLFYTTADYNEAGSARNWTQPTELASRVSAAASLGIGTRGTLDILYSGQNEPSVSWLRSTDNGRTWTEPVFVMQGYAPTFTATGIVIDTAPSGNLHAIWSIHNERAFGETVLYSRLSKDASGWSQPVTLAERDELDYGVGWANLFVQSDGTIQTLFQDGPAPPGRYSRWSADNGETWSNPRKVFDLVGENAMVGPMAEDSAGNLHAASHGRYSISGREDVHGVFYIPWEGSQWGERYPIATGSKLDEYDPQNPRLYAFGGNNLMALYGNDPPRGIWFSVAQTNAPAQSMSHQESLSSEIATSPAESTVVIESSPTPLVEPTPVNDTSMTPYRMVNPVVVGGLPVLALIGILVLINRRTSR